MSSSPSHIPLSQFEIHARNHGILMGVAWLIIFPLGVLIARYLRTFTRKWFMIHAVMQLIVGAPIFYAGWATGYKVAGGPPFNGPHKRTGLTMLILYTFQVVLGLFIHFVKIPIRWPGGRSPQNYAHGVIGVALLALASFQVHYGMSVVWPDMTGNIHPVPRSAMNAWLALITILWVLYVIGLGLLPRQFRLEAAARAQVVQEMSYQKMRTP